MNALIATLALAAIAGLALLAALALLLIGMRTEGTHLSPSGAPSSRIGGAVRRLLGLYVRRPTDGTCRKAETAAYERVGS
jgi:hypothetical protein